MKENKKRLTPLSKEEQEKRKPLPPEMLVDALQDCIYTASNLTRAAKAIKVLKKGKT